MDRPATDVAAPAVSVIVIFLDALPYLHEAVDSVRAQTLHDWELLLVDDGSTDGSSDVARSLCAQDPRRLRYIEHPGHANLGMSAARNAGLAAARGRHVAFLDADDVFLPDRLAVHVALLDAEPGVAMVQGRLQYWHGWRGVGSSADTEDRCPPVATGVPVPPPTLLGVLVESDGATAPGICSVTVRRAVVLGLGGFEPAFRSTYEDQVLLAKVYATSCVLVTPHVGARYRQHAGSSLARAGAAGRYSPGQPHHARERYLSWLAVYVASLPEVDPRIVAAVRHALAPYRRPRWLRLVALPARCLSGARRVAERWLPAVVVAPLVRWRGARKDRAALVRARRAALRLSGGG
jgi:glycosyltransferase involved in cell wall biosynthesis